MKTALATSLAALIFTAAPAMAEDAGDKEAVLNKHRDGSSKVADDQDELSADVQQLTLEQTVPKVIELLSEVEDIMDEATDRLSEPDTGGRTIAAQTEVIEKILEASKERQKQQGGSQAGSAMMDMMERMAGKGEGEKPQPGKGEGESKEGGEPGDQAGQGNGGDSDSANNAQGGPAAGQAGARKVPKAAGTAGRALPQEFRKALDAYNRGAEEKVK